MTLDRQAFRAWLVSLGHQKCGIGMNACACPVYQFLKSQGVNPVGVTSFGYTVYVGGDGAWRDHDTHLHPDWVRAFITEVDAAHGHEPVPATAALAILDTIGEPT